MREFLIHIDAKKLAEVLHSVFEKLPKEYLKAYNSFSETGAETYFRESLISKWIGIPVTDTIIFKHFEVAYRLRNIFIPTMNDIKIELQIYVNKNGIIGINIGEDIDKLLINQTDTSNFIIEKVSTSRFLTDYIDLEYLEGFDEIDEYLDNKSSSQIFTINNAPYYSILTLSDQACIAIDDRKSVYLLNTESGLTKLLFKRSNDFVRAFKSEELHWIFEL